jgi:hypothetical protein
LQELIVATAIVQWRINIVAVTTTRVKGKKEGKRLESDDENNTVPTSAIDKILALSMDWTKGSQQ